MNCDILAMTGANPLPLILVATGCIVLGLVVLLVRKRRRTAVVAALGALLLVAFVGFGTLTPAPAFAASAECSTSPDAKTSLLISESSVIDGMAPGIAPAPLSGTMTNTGRDDVHVAFITVSIASVAKSVDAVAGPCDAGDYVLANPRMPVDTTLTPNGTTPFAGAAIGFNNKSTNQDACKKAVLTLHYAISAE